MTSGSGTVRAGAGPRGRRVAAPTRPGPGPWPRPCYGPTPRGLPAAEAERALGMAARHDQDMAAAVSHLTRAIRLAERAGAPRSPPTCGSAWRSRWRTRAGSGPRWPSWTGPRRAGRAAAGPGRAAAGRGLADAGPARRRAGRVRRGAAAAGAGRGHRGAGRAAQQPGPGAVPARPARRRPGRPDPGRAALPGAGQRPGRRRGGHEHRAGRGPARGRGGGARGVRRGGPAGARLPRHRRRRPA